MVTKFKNHLARTNLARNTINSYVWTIEYFLNHYGEVNKRNLLAYKGYLVENFKPQTVNLRLQVHIPEHTRSLSGSLLGYKTIP